MIGRAGWWEHVADQLATAGRTMRRGCPPKRLRDTTRPTTAQLSEDAGRACESRFAGAVELGRAFDGAIKKRDNSHEGFTYRALHFDSKPEWVFVFGSCAGVDPEELNKRTQILMVAAMAFFT